VEGFMAGLARMVIRFRYLVIALWIGVAILTIGLFSSLSSVVNSDNSSFLPSSTPGQQAAAIASPFLPPTDSSATMVVTTSSGSLGSADSSAISSLEAKLARLDHVVSVNDQGPSPDGRAAKALLIVDVQPSSADAKPLVDAMRSTAAGAGMPPGLATHFTGTLPSAVDNQDAQASAERRTEIFSNLVILVMLVLVFRGALAPLVTLIPAVLALEIAERVVAQASSAGLQVSSVTQIMLTVLVLGAGTDYGLFLILRVREEMGRGATMHEAIELAARRVGESITFSAGTVIAALLSLLLASFGLYSGLGPALAVGIAIMLVAALTLLPALLAVFGAAVFWPRGVPTAAREGMWVRIAEQVVRRPVPTLVAGVVIFGGLAFAATGYQSSGFGGTTTGPPGSDSAEGTQALDQHYTAAVANPTVVLLRFPRSVWENVAVVQDAEQQLAAQPVFSSVNGMIDPNGTAISAQTLSSLFQQLGPPEKLPATPPPNSPVPPQEYQLYRSTAQFVSADGTTVQFYTTLAAGDPSTKAALDAVPAVRDSVSHVAGNVGATANGVSGLAPVSYDVSTVSQDDLQHIVPVVLVLIGLLLGILLRSVVAPLYLVISVGFSYLAALGLAVLLFMHVIGDSGVDFVLPFLLFIFLMALGEDYNILVMSRIREEAWHAPLRQAVARAIHATGTPVTSAGLILAATFGVAGLTGPNDQVKELGSAIALGVLLDTFLVRTLLVPSTVVLLGRWNWWPSSLSRRTSPPRVPPRTGPRTPAPSQWASRRQR
jgi:putative drug exporter of the RND superfamily